MRAVRLAACAAVALGWAAVSADSADAQDIEAAAAVRGLRLPDAYYERVRVDPAAYKLPNGMFRTLESGERVASRAEGTAKLAIVLALFSDSQEPAITRDMIQSALFDGPAQYGTITEAYQEISRGALTVTGEVLPWVRTSRPMTTVVGTGNGLGSDASLGPYFSEALDLVDVDVDFGEYDSDGPDGLANSGDDDGFVDALTFEFLEIAGSCGGPSIWPHRWSISGATQAGPYQTNDASANGDQIKVDGYITQSVTDCTGARVQSANVISHEYGHVLGLPDYYHPTAEGGAQGRRWVLGCWSLMAAGSWGCGPVDDRDEPFGPTHMVARSKNFLGWLDYVDIGEVWNQEIFLDPVQSSGQALRIQMDAVGREFLVAELRMRTGFDASIPADGVLFYKQDLDAALRPDPTTTNPYFLTLLEQDGNRGLTRNFFEGGNRGEATDAWGVDGFSRKLHASTTPQLLLSNGQATAVTVHEVSVVDGRARLVISTGRTPQIVPPEASIEVERVAPFLQFLRIAGGVQPYTATGDVPASVTLSGNGDEVYVGGFVTEAGPHEWSFSVQDALGFTSEPVTMTLTTTPWVVEVTELLRPFLVSEGVALSPGERVYLDQIGNNNGRYDVGDLRKWLRSQGSGVD